MAARKAEPEHGSGKGENWSQSQEVSELLIILLLRVASSEQKTQPATHLGRRKASSLSSRWSFPLASIRWSPISKGSGSTPGKEQTCSRRASPSARTPRLEKRTARHRKRPSSHERHTGRISPLPEAFHNLFARSRCLTSVTGPGTANVTNDAYLRGKPTPRDTEPQGDAKGPRPKMEILWLSL